MYFMNKTLTFAVVHFFVAFSVTWMITGSFVLGGLIAMIEPAVNTIAYFFHEKAWARFGRRQAEAAASLETKVISADIR